MRILSARVVLRLKNKMIASAFDGFVANVRLFPPLAIMVTLLVLRNTVMRKRVYYMLLRHGAIVHFHNTRAPNKKLTRWTVSDLQ